MSTLDPVGVDGERVVALLRGTDDGDPEVAQHPGERAERTATHLCGRVETEDAATSSGEHRQEPRGGGAVAAEDRGRRDSRPGKDLPGQIGEE
jgi:hypothetical protein